MARLELSHIFIWKPESGSQSMCHRGTLGDEYGMGKKRERDRQRENEKEDKHDWAYDTVIYNNIYSSSQFLAQSS